MSSKINVPYKLTKSDTKIISDNFSTYHDWNKPVFEDFKVKLREHLRTEQNNKCCYCKKNLGFDIKDVDIEHIVPKSEYEQFTFFPKNLALACPGCNTSKGSEKVLKREIKRYPTTSTNFTIIHPHYDDYYQHISILDDCIYVGNSKVGCNTITVCHLYRLKNVEENAKKHISEKSIISSLVEELRKSKPGDVDDLISELSRFLR